MLVTPGGAPLTRGYYLIILIGFQFGSLRSHIWPTSMSATGASRD